MEFILVLLAIGLLTPFFIYNRLVGKRNQVENAFGSIDVYLEKRFDLIPNLVGAVKTYMEHEASVLTEITEKRAQTSSMSPEEKMALADKAETALQGIMVQVENYPDLKANQNFLQLQGSLNEIEEQLSAARRTYNASVTAYNNTVEMFPSSIIAGMMNFDRKDILEVTENKRETPQVNELFNA
jgi:LemA protein